MHRLDGWGSTSLGAPVLAASACSNDPSVAPVLQQGCVFAPGLALCLNKFSLQVWLPVPAIEPPLAPEV